MKKFTNELRADRRKLAEIIFDNGFTEEITPQTVSNFTKEGFAIGGSFGANFTKEKGLTVWNRGQRGAGSRFTVKELVELEKQLTEAFNEIWDI